MAPRPPATPGSAQHSSQVPTASSLNGRAKTRREKRRKKAILRRVVESKAIEKLGIDTYKKKVQSHYDGPAGAVLAIGSMLSLHEPLVGRLIRSGTFDVTGFDSILDIGSGAGQIMGHLADCVRPDARLTGIDLSAGMLGRAEKRVKSDQPSYTAADMTNLPFADGSFDCVTCGFVIEHLPDPMPGLIEMRRVLRPGGRMLLLATEDTYLGAWVSRTWNCRTYNRDELAASCAEAGIPVARTLWFTPVHKSLKMGGIAFDCVRED